MSKSVICSERGVLDAIPTAIPDGDSRTLHDFPKEPTTPQLEVYRVAHPAEISEPT
jgi:hypothetical protein